MFEDAKVDSEIGPPPSVAILIDAVEEDQECIPAGAFDAHNTSIDDCAIIFILAEFPGIFYFFKSFAHQINYCKNADFLITSRIKRVNSEQEFSSLI